MRRFLSLPKAVLSGILLFLAAASLAAQDDVPPAADSSQDSKFSFGLFSSIGNESIEGTNYQYLGLLPDFGYGPWGVGIDLSFHFRLYEKPDGDFGFYPRSQDWWDSNLSTMKNVDKYLARLAYLRYGKKGDPLYVQLGQIQAASLGTGFIVAGYNNGALKPAVKLTGINFDISGSLFELPWMGAESFVGNISTFNLMGFRAYAKPFAPFSPESPILKELQVGATIVADTNPNANLAKSDSPGTVVITGVDAIAPLYGNEVFTSRATLDITTEGKNVGSALGLDGTLVKVVNWGLQGRAFGANFLPNYVDQGYEISRARKFKVYNGDVSLPATLGWQASLGTVLFADIFRVGFTLSGPFGSASSIDAQPQLVGYANLKSGQLPFDFSAYYLKQGLTSFEKLATPKDALIGAKVGWVFGIVTLSVIYDLHYDAESTKSDPWVTTSRVETSVKMF